MSLPANPLDQWLLVHMTIGTPVAVWLAQKDWGKFREYQRQIRKDGPIYTVVTVVLGTFVIALGWPAFLALYIGDTLGRRLRNQPRFARWRDRKKAEWRNRRKS